MKKHDKIYDISHEVTAISGSKISGLRDLFDMGEITYSATTIQEKIEITQAICKTAKCTFADIYTAFINEYDNERYQHIMPASKAGVFAIYAQAYSDHKGHQKDSNQNLDAKKIIEEVIESYKRNKGKSAKHMISKVLSLSPISSAIVLIWQVEHQESLDFCISKAIELIDEKLNH